MKQYKKFLFFFTYTAVLNSLYAQKFPVVVKSPDKNIQVQIGINSNREAYYSVSLNNQLVLKPSKLGLITTEGDYAHNVKFSKATPEAPVKDSYVLFTGKKRSITYSANKRTVRFLNNSSKPFDVIFQVSNDGVAFRYHINDKSSSIKNITEEVTSYHLDTSTRGFLQPIAVAKSGWEATNPSYEEHYQQNIKVGTPSTNGAGWVYPALFNNKNNWILISETSLDSNYCATRLRSESPDGEYRIGFPDAREIYTGGGLLPKYQNELLSPWRIITIGSLNTVIESTLGTDLAKPSDLTNTAFIKPGNASWSWIMSKDDFIVYSEQKKYIDFAADMHWPYCLIDADWDRKIGYDKVKELADYAATKNVSLLVWYNSSGDWNTVKYTPKNKLLTHESREAEFSRLREMGIKGVKIDFFGGDGQSMIKYYIDILEDAAESELMVNFHGATLPRGWSRTYPNLVTTEAVKGFEMVTFTQGDANAQPNHCAMLPFTRNAFDPMDFTPVNLYKIPTSVKRQTSSSYELALSVMFLSGIQHIAESPEGMSHVPDYVKSFMQTVPARWDDVKFIDGFPGKWVVLARRSGNKWYVAGINGENLERSVSISPALFKGKAAKLITDGSEALSFKSEDILFQRSTDKKIVMKPNGGFVMTIE